MVREERQATREGIAEAIEMPRAYAPTEIEPRVYERWLAADVFAPDGQGTRADLSRQPFVIIQPPPNVTGALHLGHAARATVEDLMARRARMQGRPTLWLPGLDHASIAAQFVLDGILATEGLSREKVGREAYLERMWRFMDETREVMTRQHRRLGVSVDWSRLRFTMDEVSAKAVSTSFKQLYDDGLAYRGEQLINWCPGCRTSLSDLEVVATPEAGTLWSVRYHLVPRDGAEEDSITVATTRPETILGDTAVAVHPDDERFSAFVGRQAVIPFVDRIVPVIADEMVDRAFGTGAVKITPAHDQVDFETAQRHSLPILDVMDDAAVINEHGGPFAGLSREEARTRILHALEAAGDVVAAVPHEMVIGRCQRSDDIVEPRIKTQWFIKVKPMAERAMAAVREGRTRIVPARYEKVFFDWMENIRDWNVSRQLWWGHRIPVWYGPDGEVVASKESPGEGFEQDTDILDTWFSSGLWPFATLGWPEENEDIEYFYPTSLLSTAREIMYLWVARMIMNGIKFRGEVPFRKINVHSIVLAEDGTKMSKSKGNTINPLDLLDEYGTDAVRFGLLYQSSTQDFAYSYERASMGRAFVTKLWNAMRFIMSGNFEGEGGLSVSDRWILAGFNRLARDYDTLLEECEFSEAMRRVYDFAWHEFADWYIEIAKTAPSSETPKILREVFLGVVKLLHPVMPFATEEMARTLGEEKYLVRQSLPIYDATLEDTDAERMLDRTKRAVSAVRAFRAEAKVDGELEGRAPEGVELSVFATLARVKLVDEVDDSRRATLPAGDDVVVEVALTEEMRRGEISRLDKEISRVGGEVSRAEKKLGNEKFVERAPAEVVAAERGKLEANTKLLATLRERLDEYHR